MGATLSISLNMRAQHLTFAAIVGLIALTSAIDQPSVSLKDFVNAMPEGLAAEGDIVYKMWESQRNVQFVAAPRFDATCGDPGYCGAGYSACCALYAEKFHAPCGCHLVGNGTGASDGVCGHCGIAYQACCVGFSTKGIPCKCDAKQ